jgi:hypothetical protein
MTIEDIRGAIKVSGNQVVVTEATLGSTDVTAALAEYFPAKMMTIRPATIISAANDDFVLVQGSIALLNVQVAGTVRFYMDGADAQFDLSGTLPQGWHFGDSFDSLKDSYFAQFDLGDPKVRLLSKATADAVRGLTLTAGFTLPPVLEALRWFAAPDVNAKLSGPVDLDAGQPSMNLTVSPNIHASLGGYLDVTLRMQQVTRTYRKRPAQGKPIVVAVSQLSCDLSFNHNGTPVDVPILAMFNQELSVLHLRLEPGKAFDLALSEIAHWLDGTNLQSEGMPSSYRPPLGLTLHDVDFAVGLQTKRLEYITLIVQSTQPWHVVDKVDIDGVVIEFMVMPGGSPPVAGSIVGRLKLGTAATLDVYAQIPDFLIRGGLAEGSAIDLTPLIQYLGGVSAGVPSTLKMDVLSFEAHPSGSYYSFEIDVEGDWEIVKQLKVEEIGAAVKYDNGAVDATFKGDFIVGGVDVAIRAEYDSEAGGWQFSGTLAEGQTVEVGSLLADLEDKFGITLPEFLYGIRLDTFTHHFNTSQKKFNFEIGGDIPVEGGRLKSVITLGVEQVTGSEGHEWYKFSLGGSATISGFTFTLDFLHDSEQLLLGNLLGCGAQEHTQLDCWYLYQRCSAHPGTT